MSAMGRMILENIPMKKISYISVRALADFFRLRLKKLELL